MKTMWLGLLLAAVLGLAVQAQPAKTAAPEIVMYVMPDCGYCAAARAYLKQRGLAWQEHDITTSQSAAKEFSARGGQGTPLILVDGTVVHGFNAQRMDAALAKP